MGNNKTQIIAEPGKQDITIIREFDAPRELVFKAFTDRDLYVQWLGPKDLTMDLDVFEPKTGGSWRYVQKDKDGNAFAFRGVNHEVKQNERIIGTFEFEAMPGHVALETAMFEELPDKRTKLTTLSVFQSIADRDGMVQSGMDKGVYDSHERLEKLLETLKQH